MAAARDLVVTVGLDTTKLIAQFREIGAAFLDQAAAMERAQQGRKPLDIVVPVTSEIKLGVRS